MLAACLAVLLERAGRSKRRSITSALLLTGVSAFTAIAQVPPAGTIAGVVVARADGRAVAGAVVEVEGATLSAAANGVGRFAIENAPTGETVLVVRAPGFLELRVPGLQVAASQPLELRVELELTPNFMERIQVTATKSALSIGEVPAQTDVVDRETIDRRGDQELTQAIAHIPGLIISTQAGSFESVALRGMPRDGNEFTNTLLLIDGVPQTDSRNSARVVNLPINDARAIEVVRGPNSALSGYPLYSSCPDGGTIALIYQLLVGRQMPIGCLGAVCFTANL